LTNLVCLTHSGEKDKTQVTSCRRGWGEIRQKNLNLGKIFSRFVVRKGVLGKIFLPTWVVSKCGGQTCSPAGC